MINTTDDYSQPPGSERARQPPAEASLRVVDGWGAAWGAVTTALFRAVPSFELAISQAIYHSKWLLGRFLGLMKGIEGQATETAA
jgi:hypothetical protein